MASRFVTEVVRCFMDLQIGFFLGLEHIFTIRRPTIAKVDSARDATQAGCHRRAHAPWPPMCEVFMLCAAAAGRAEKADVAEQRRAEAALAAAAPSTERMTREFTVTNDTKQSFGLALTGKNRVSSISPTGLAAAAGVQQGDVLLSVNGVEVTDQAKLFKQFRSIANGTTVTFSVER